jgi:hypothetical protein
MPDNGPHETLLVAKAFLQFGSENRSGFTPRSVQACVRLHTMTIQLIAATLASKRRFALYVTSLIRSCAVEKGDIAAGSYWLCSDIIFADRFCSSALSRLTHRIRCAAHCPEGR